jgi:predicted Zn-dependent protease
MQKTLLVIPSFIFLSGCAYLQPFVQDYNVVSVPSEIQIGEEAERQVAAEMPLSRDAALTARVNALGERLVRALPRQDYDYEFFVVDDKTPNAFTIPGGKVYVHTGLLNFAANDDEVAGVMAHEIGHAYQRHPAKLISRQYGVEKLSQLLFKGNQPQMKAIAFQIAKGSILNYYGREDEFEADETGFYILRRAGIPTRGLVSFFTRLQTLEQRGSILKILSSHPPTQERITRLNELETGRRQPTLAFQPLAGNS